MRFYILSILTFAWINLFAFKAGPEDTTTFKLNIKPISQILLTIDNHAKFDEWDFVELYMADTLYLAVDRVIYKCNKTFAIETLAKIRFLIKNNNYKYSLTENPTYTYNFSYFGYYEHVKYEVTIQFTEVNNQIIFIAATASPVDD